jgi:endonuclease/exonuclease/phosphatase family metal-dependent hydrolase
VVGGPLLILVTFNTQHGRRPDGVVDTALLAETCASFAADVLALQEVDVGTRRSGGLDQSQVVADACGMHVVFGPAIPRYGNALLAREPITEVELVELPYTPDREPRSAIVARVGVITVAATHLGLRGDAHDQLHVVVGALLARPGPHVLLGDLNLESGAVHVAPLARVDTPPTFPADGPRRTIDHVALGGLTPSRAVVLPRPPVSDHRPLLVEASV